MKTERFGSFKVDHSKLMPGLYLSREDRVNGVCIYTLDIRCRAPYKELPMSVITAHSVEHILATELETISGFYNIQKVYFGPQGCLTGYYYVFAVVNNKESCALSSVSEMVACNLVRACVNWLNSSKKVPFNSELECGNNRTLASTSAEYDEVVDVIKEIKVLAKRVVDQGKFDQYPVLI